MPPKPQCLRFLSCLIVLAGPAVAEQPCLTAAALKTGITVSVRQGSTQSYRAKGRDVQAVVPVPSGSFTAELLLARGLHVIRDHRTEHETAPPPPEGEVLVGGNEGGTLTTEYAYGRLANPGTDWAGTVRVTREQDGPAIGPQPTIKGRLAAEVRFLPEETVTISGCAYRIRPVETEFRLGDDSGFTIGGEPAEEIAGAAGTLLMTRRQIWFPDLGFAVITRERGQDSGWGADWGQGIIGLAAE